MQLDLPKGQLISKKIVKPRILPKNEQMNSFLLLCAYATCFRSLFGRILGQKKTFRDFLTFSIPMIISLGYLQATNLGIAVYDLIFYDAWLISIIKKVL